MCDAYITTRDGGYWIGESRVALDSVVYRFLEGLSPESIAESFPALTLEQIYGAITYYLAHRATIDAYLQARDADYAVFRQQLRARYPRPSQRLDALRQTPEALRA
jgi:uncharacterized protein (DUF433 family)